jgi:hypothetical protein
VATDAIARHGLFQAIDQMSRRDQDLDRPLLNQLAQTLGVQDLLGELEAEMRAGWSPLEGSLEA